MDTVAVTDHGNMFGAIDLYTEAKNAGTKLIFGYVDPYSRRRRDRTDRTNRRNYHLILLREERRRLQEPRVPELDGLPRGLLLQPAHRQAAPPASTATGQIGMSACLGGEIAQTLEKNGVAEAEEVAKEVRERYSRPGTSSSS